MIAMETSSSVIDFHQIAFELVRMIIWIMVAAAAMVLAGMVCFLILVSKTVNGNEKSSGNSKDVLKTVR